jgi:Trypsin-like peptidase domain
MAIVLPQGRPAIDIADGSYERPDEPWAHLGDTEPRARLEASIGAVGRLEGAEGSRLPFLGTAFAVGPDLVLSLTFGMLTREEDAVSGRELPVLDFGHELLPRKSLRVDIEDVLYVNARWGVEVLRAQLPKTVQPLRLSVLDPETLTDREVVLLGYPSSDPRSDPALVQRIFRGVLDVKRLLPGRIRAPDLVDDERRVLVHDCASLGGCAGGPLVDVTTGDVVGVHFAGRYLEANQAAPAWELARDPSFVGTGVLFAGNVPTFGPTLATPGPPRAEDTAAVERPAERAAPGDGAALDVPEEGALEGLVIKQARPALIVPQWRDELDESWRTRLMPHEKRLDSAVRAVGKLLSGVEADEWTGTVFLVGDRLALTASFLAQDFAEGAGLEASIKSGRHPAVDFAEALGMPPGSATVAVTAVRFIHPYFHVALLELERVPESTASLDLAARLPSELSGRPVAVISFAGPRVHGSGNDADLQKSWYGERWGRLFIQPGNAVQVGQLPDESDLPAIVHDCTTSAGSAGAPVIDLGTGYVIGVHTHAKWLEGGFAQPTWELARDPFVWDCPVGFRPDPRPPWLDRWAGMGRAPATPANPFPDTGPLHWTVDEVPIDWTREEPRELERLLVQAVDAQIALYRAENVGLPLGMVDRTARSQILWREILKYAATAGLLRRLLEEFAAAPEYAGIAPKLRAYL